MASLRIEGVSLEACLKEKLLQSIIKMKPFIWSSGSSIRTSSDSRMARRMSVKEFLHKAERGRAWISADDGTQCVEPWPAHSAPDPCCCLPDQAQLSYLQRSASPRPSRPTLSLPWALQGWTAPAWFILWWVLRVSLLYCGPLISVLGSVYLQAFFS